MSIDLEHKDGCAKFTVAHSNVDDSDGSVDVLLVDMSPHKLPGFVSVNVWQHGQRAPHGQRGVTGHGTIMLSLSQAAKLYGDLSEALDKHSDDMVL